MWAAGCRGVGVRLVSVCVRAVSLMRLRGRAVATWCRPPVEVRSGSERAICGMSRQNPRRIPVGDCEQAFLCLRGKFGRRAVQLGRCHHHTDAFD